MSDESYDKDIKRYIRDTITYVINKKMNTLNTDLQYISNKVDKNNELIAELINILKLNNEKTTKLNICNSANSSKMFKSISTKSVELLTDISNLDGKNNDNITTIESNNDSVLYDNDNKVNQKEKNDKSDEKPIKTYKSKTKKASTGNALYKEVKVEYINIDPDFIKECLSACSLEADIKLFKKMYIDDVDKTQYPIRHMKKKYQYWLDDKMNDDDSSGTYIKNTVIKNIEQCYLSVNIYIDNDMDIDDFIKNQEYISKLSEQKYKDQFLKKIVGIITI